MKIRLATALGVALLAVAVSQAIAAKRDRVEICHFEDHKGDKLGACNGAVGGRTMTINGNGLRGHGLE